MKIVVELIRGPKVLDRFMHAMDVYSGSKRLGMYECVELTFDKVVVPKDILKHFVDALDDAGQHTIFASILRIDNNYRPNVEPYIMRHVSVVSTGHQWILFKNQLEQLGYVVETDIHMHVLTAKHKDINPDG